jgi:sugar lactone lactonase YvrE
VKHWTAEVVVDAQNELGEGTLWDAEQQKLWWVDIYGKRVFAYEPHSARHDAYDTADVVGTVVIGSDARPVVAQGCNVAVLDPLDNKLTPLANVESRGKGYRLNDGKCDPWGRLWVGSMVEHGPNGSAGLFCVDGRTLESKNRTPRVTELFRGVTISNGLVWDDDGRRFYYIDTPTQQVFAFDCDLATLSLSNRRVLHEFPPDMGSPDGMTIDAEGQLWIALFGGRSVVRLDPLRGELTGRVDVGAKNVTSCAFGGSNLSTLYISTARLATSPEELELLPHAGALFRVELPVSGRVATRFLNGSTT